MNRIYFVSDSLERVEDAERILSTHGIPQNSFHLYSSDVAKAESKGLHTLNLFEKTNLLPALAKGLLIGLLAFSATLIAAQYANISETYTWTPVIMLSLFLLGFSTWEAGLYGAQETNQALSRHDKHLQKGHHIFYVDCSTEQTALVCGICHDELQMAFT